MPASPRARANRSHRSAARRFCKRSSVLNTRKQMFKQQKYRLFCAFLILLAFAASASAQATREFDVANQLYEQGKFSEAKQNYEAIVRMGNFSGNLFYNLGNTEWKLGNPGAAILNYERALALEPAHPEARANLQFVRNQTGAKFATQRWWDRLFLDWSTSRYAILAAVATWGALFFLAAILFRVRRRESSGGLWLALVVCVLICGYALSAVWLAEKESGLAIVTAKRADARFAPADTATLADILPTGSHVRILQEHGAWIYCELPGNNTRAWIAANAIERVKPGS